MKYVILSFLALVITDVSAVQTTGRPDEYGVGSNNMPAEYQNMRGEAVSNGIQNQIENDYLKKYQEEQKRIENNSAPSGNYDHRTAAPK
jgi:hypothetical protein